MEFISQSPLFLHTHFFPLRNWLANKLCLPDQNTAHYHLGWHIKEKFKWILFTFDHNYHPLLLTYT